MTLRTRLQAQNQTFEQVWCFGDSWGVGNELRFGDGEVPFATLLSRKWGCRLKNQSKENHSLGMITRQVANYAGLIGDQDLVLVVVPPDSRWYTQWRTIPYSNREFFQDKDDDWFRYHHQLFVFSICEMLNRTGCTYILMHNYGQYPLTKSEYFMCEHHHDKFLNRKSLTHLLTNTPNDQLSPTKIEKLAHNAPQNIFRGPYFAGCREHPNQAGHQRIADLILEKLKKWTNHKDKQ